MDNDIWATGTTDQRGEPYSFTMHLRNVVVIVHRHTDHPLDQWLLSVRGLSWIENHPLQAKDAVTAKEEAVGMVVDQLRGTIGALCANMGWM